MNRFKKAAVRIGFTEAEFGVIIFLLVTAFIGTLALYFNNNIDKVPETDYTKQDLLYAELAPKADDTVFLSKNTEKSIDSKQKLFDLSGDKYSFNKHIAIEGRFINVNTADKTTLMILPGIGAITADKIIEYRSLNGRFRKPEEIMNVKGIGEKKFEKLKKFIIVE